MARRKGASPAVAARWEERVARHRASGLSVAEFCRRERVHPVSFYGWRRRLAASSKRGRRAPTSRAFLPIQLVTDGPAPTRQGSGHACELVLGPLVCRVPCGLDDESLRRWIRLFREEASRC
jgi:transposase-like protein